MVISKLIEMLQTHLAVYGDEEVELQVAGEETCPRGTAATVQESAGKCLIQDLYSDNS